MANRDYTPPASRSGEINLLNEAIQVAVQSTIQAMSDKNSGQGMEQCREELDTIKTEIRNEFGALRNNIAVEFSTIRQDISSVKVDLAEGKTEFALLNQRMDLDDKAKEREARAALERRKHDTTPIKGYRYALSSPTLPVVEPEEKPIIPAKILNGLILALVAAAGAALWGVLSSAIWPGAPKSHMPEPSKTAPVLVPPVPEPTPTLPAH